jgi:endonuclease/exonuclease/phosphatase family metal-dependent hydrolase
MNHNATTARILFVAIFVSIFGSFVSANESERTVKVMTYNMYLGADLTGIFQAQSPEELVVEVGEAYSDVQAGNVPERIDEIADQIATNNPDVVGLQEVALWRIGAPFDPAPAETVSFDFLQILLDRLTARGAHYTAVSVQNNLDAELTGVFGPTSALDVRYTDRVVVLARTDLPTSEFKVEKTAAEDFQTLLPVNVLGNTVYITRGWASADIKHRGKTYRFVNTHLESFYDPIQNAQAYELLLGPTNTTLPVILAGDFNSDPALNGYTYYLLLNGGLTDVWISLVPGNPGYTWPLSGESPAVIANPSQRVDYIMSRGPVSLSGIDLVGEDPVNDLTQSSLRPSDHAGIIATVVLEP